MRRPKMTKGVARGLFAMEKVYGTIFDDVFGDIYTQMLEEAESGVKEGKFEAVPFLEIEDARDYIFDLNEYYDRAETS